MCQIVKDKRSKFVLIQIKTSLVPCNDCIDFWTKSIGISKKEGDKYYFDFGTSTKDKITIDWLKSLGVEFKCPIAVSINSSVKVNHDEEVKSSLPVERII